MGDRVGGLEWLSGIISLDWPGEVVVGLEQCWWSWRISGLF